MKHQDDINSNLDTILGNENVLSVLLEFEGMLDNADIYAFKNWQVGEVVDGPKLGRYWVTVGLMYPYKMMPDPIGAERLVGYGCKVEYEKIKYTRPVKIRTQDDLETSDDGKRVPKMISSPAWLITITMPRRYIDEDLLDTDEDEFNQEAVNDAYDQGLDEESALNGAEDQTEEEQGQESAPEGKEQQ
jgi:hypothetical protein